jgi:hypothetical protein
MRHDPGVHRDPCGHRGVDAARGTELGDRDGLPCAQPGVVGDAGPLLPEDQQTVARQARVFQAALDSALPEASLGAHLTSSEFTVDVAENWQSEYLQFFLYIVLTIWLVQRGSPESKALDKTGRESDEDQLVGEHAKPDSPAWAKATGWRRALFSRSLGLVMGLFFVLSWTAQFIAGRSPYNAEQLMDLQASGAQGGEYLLAIHLDHLVVAPPGWPHGSRRNQPLPVFAEISAAHGLRLRGRGFVDRGLEVVTCVGEVEALVGDGEVGHDRVLQRDG